MISDCDQISSYENHPRAVNGQDSSDALQEKSGL